ncbi:MAG: hypothetical protein U0R76_11385 [Candidatus Nanopelagicales bacterium]
MHESLGASSTGAAWVPIALALAVAAAYAATWWYLRARAFPEFRARLDGTVVFPLLATPVAAWRMGSTAWALYILGVLLACGWTASRGRFERWFPKRWFHLTGQAPPWLTGWEIAAFWLLVAIGCIPMYIAVVA